MTASSHLLLRSSRSTLRRVSTGTAAVNAATRAFSSSHSDSHDRLLVVGSGVAGSAAALVAAEMHQIPVTMLFAGSIPEDCNSYWAQGGIIYRNFCQKSGDSPQALAQDIVKAGAGLCELDAVRKVATEGPDRVRQLLLDDEDGPFSNVPFDRTENGELSLCLEASHCAPRILHHADHTGKVITEHITRAAARHPLITLQPNTVVTDLVVQDGMCVGVETLDIPTNSQSSLGASRGTVLCSGGLAGIYQHSTNPPGFNALGSSVALARRASVQTQELEFVQFHPTSLNIPNEARFLLTEALRGEGAILRNSEGRAFAKDFDPQGELAPRDIVARGVFEESKEGDVFLDITHRDADWLYERFPTIQAHLSKRNLDLSKDWLPVIPAAHYTCGGISTNLKGCTSLPNLYAAGEAARTGLHGGNRLASTSLLEGLVFGASVAEEVSRQGNVHDAARMTLETMPTRTARTQKKQSKSSNMMATELLQAVRKCMWDHVGVIRTASGLQIALDELSCLSQEATELHLTHPTPQSAGVRDAAIAGLAVAQAAMQNKTSVGAHCIREDEEVASDSDEEEVAAAGMQ